MNRTAPTLLVACTAVLFAPLTASSAPEDLVQDLAEALGQHDVERSKLDESGWGAVRSCAETVRRIDEAMEDETSARKRAQLTTLRQKAVACSKTSAQLTREGIALAEECGDVLRTLASERPSSAVIKAGTACLKRLARYAAQAQAHAKVIEAQAKVVQNDFDPVVRFCTKAVGRLQEACFAGARASEFTKPELAYVMKACEVHSALTLERCRPGPALNFSTACDEATTYGRTLSRMVELTEPGVAKKLSMDQGSVGNHAYQLLQLEEPVISRRRSLLERAIEAGHAWLSTTVSAANREKCSIADRIAGIDGEKNAQLGKDMVATVKSQWRQISACQQLNLAKHPGAMGDVKIRWRVAKDATTILSSEPTTSDTTEFIACISRGIVEWFGADFARSEPYAYRFPVTPERRAASDVEL